MRHQVSSWGHLRDRHGLLQAWRSAVSWRTDASCEQSEPEVEVRNLLVMSSDTHGGPRPEEYRRYMEAAYRDDLERYLAAKPDNPMEEIVRLAGGADRLVTQDGERRIEFATLLDRRLEVLESDGVVGEVIFPDGSMDNLIPFTGVFGGPGRFSGELHRAALRAYNRWLGENSVPDWQLGLALIPIANVDYAVTQIEEARGRGLRGVYLEFDSLSDRLFFDPRYDPLWAACAAQSLPVHFHTGSGHPEGSENLLGDARDGTEKARRMSSDTEIRMISGHAKLYWSHRALWQLIWGGVLERFPRSGSCSQR
jgi:hypothetical protein